MYPLTPEDANDIVAEERHYQKEFNKALNTVMSLPVGERKQAAYKRLVPTPDYTDIELDGSVW